MKIHKIKNFKDSKRYFYMISVFNFWIVFGGSWYHLELWKRKYGDSVLEMALEYNHLIK